MKAGKCARYGAPDVEFVAVAQASALGVSDSRRAAGSSVHNLPIANKTINWLIQTLSMTTSEKTTRGHAAPASVRFPPFATLEMPARFGDAFRVSF